MQEIESNENQNNLKSVLIQVLVIVPFLKKEWKKIAFGVLLGLLIGIGIEIKRSREGTVKSKIIFILENDNGGGGGGLADIASSLGIGGATAGTSLFSGENFQELLKTRIIYRKALLTKVKYGNQEDYFGNIFLEHCQLKDNEWGHLPPQFFTYRFNNPDLNSLSPEDKNLLNTIYSYLKDNTVVTQSNSKSSFQTLSVEMKSDTLAYVWSKLFLKTVTDYYIETKTKKSKELLKVMENRVDSLQSALYYTQGKLANYNDQNQQIIFQRARIIAERLQMTSSQLQGLYFEASRNLDNLKFSLVKEAPLLTIIEDTELPILRGNYTYGPVTFISVLISFILTCFVIYLYNLYVEFYSNKKLNKND
jgi:hypothetical protein